MLSVNAASEARRLELSESEVIPSEENLPTATSSDSTILAEPEPEETENFPVTDAITQEKDVSPKHASTESISQNQSSPHKTALPVETSPKQVQSEPSVLHAETTESTPDFPDTPHENRESVANEHLESKSPVISEKDEIIPINEADVMPIEENANHILPQNIISQDDNAHVPNEEGQLSESPQMRPQSTSTATQVEHSIFGKAMCLLNFLQLKINYSCFFLNF